ncbi:hypothetical protein TNCV_1142201 [Trichonephila clavipes]|nr:hypothetical protein TNCV_1142201 [Trichonephila clavipes]
MRCGIVVLEKELSTLKFFKNVSDEAHFWLNGYVNKQNCRKADPQVYVETPSHPEKLTVLCALWAGGILLNVTVKSV